MAVAVKKTESRRQEPEDRSQESEGAPGCLPTSDFCLLDFSIRDTGIGISPDKQAQVFEPFVQADASTTRRHGGSGLGLSIASRWVRRMGGRLVLRSEPGAGSTFRFTIPFQLATEGSQRSVAAETPVPPPGRPAGDGRRMRLLVAEDNAINQRLIRDVLKSLGHEVVVVASGREVLAETARQPFDMIFMDVQMPEVDGLQTTAQLRERERAGGRRAVIIALTAHAQAGYRDVCLRAGMDDYVSKPFRIQDIKDVLARMEPGRP